MARRAGIRHGERDRHDRAERARSRDRIRWFDAEQHRAHEARWRETDGDAEEDRDRRETQWSELDLILKKPDRAPITTRGLYPTDNSYQDPGLGSRLG